MPHYQLRAEHFRPGDRGAALWHVVRMGAAFALCTRLMDPVTPVKPIGEVDEVPAGRRCPRCWDRAFHGLPVPGGHVADRRVAPPTGSPTGSAD